MKTLVPGRKFTTRWIAPTFTKGLRFPGTTGNYITSPDSVLNSPTGDVDIRVCCKPSSVNPSGNQSFIAKRLPDGNAGSWSFRMNPGGFIDFPFWNSLSGVTIPNSGGSGGANNNFGLIGIIANQVIWLRVTLDVDNGAGGNTTRFYYSFDGLTWNTMGTAQVNVGVADIGDFANQLVIGGTAGQEFAGTIYYAEVRNGIDGPVVARFDSSQVQGASTQSPATIPGWNWNGTTLFKRDDYVRLTGAAGSYLSRAKVASEQVLGDIDLRIKCSLDDITARNTFMAKQQTTVQRQFDFEIGNGLAKRPWFSLSSDGSATTSFVATVDTPFVNGQVGWYRVTWRMSDGLLTFSTSPDGITYTPLGATGTLQAGVPMFDSTSILELGSRIAGTNAVMAGNIYYAELRNGINGPVVALFDARSVQTPWTFNGTGWLWDAEGGGFTGKPPIALNIPAVNGNYASAPDSPALPTGDIDIRAKIAPVKWVPLTTNGQTIVGRWFSGTTRSFGFNLTTSDGLELMTSQDGVTQNFGSRSGVSAFTNAHTDGLPLWVRCTRTQADGVTNFYFSTDGAAWTPVGASVVIAAGTALFDSPDTLRVGTNNDSGGRQFEGKIYYVEIRAGIDGPIVAMFDPARMAKTGTRTPATTTQPGGTPNMLSPQQASAEDGTTTGIGNHLNATLGNSAVEFLDGTKSFSMTATAAGISRIHFLEGNAGRPVVPGKMYVATSNVKRAVARSVQLHTAYYDSAGAFLSNGGFSASPVVGGTWTPLTSTSVAPANAVFATQLITVIDAAQALGEVTFIDRNSFVEAANIWTMAGSAWDLVAA